MELIRDFFRYRFLHTLLIAFMSILAPFGAAFGALCAAKIGCCFLKLFLGNTGGKVAYAPLLISSTAS